MATFPSVIAKLVGFNDAGGTTHSINIPPGLPGDLLVVVFSSDGGVTVTIDQGTGWQQVGQQSNGSSVTGAVFWKVAEGGDFLRLQTSASELTTHITYRIAGAGSVSGTAADGSSSNSNPPEHIGHLATKPYLWLVTRSADGGTVTATSPPNGFGNLTSAVSPALDTASASTEVAESASIDASNDPGSFTSSSEQWVCWTLAVAPPANIEEPNALLHGVASLDVKANPKPIAALTGRASLEVKRVYQVSQNVIKAIKHSFSRHDHDWRMMDVSHFEHEEHHTVVEQQQDLNDPNKFIFVSRTIVRRRRTVVWSVESLPLEAGLSFQAEYVNGEIESLQVTYLGTTYNVVDEELLELLESKGQITKKAIKDILIPLLSRVFATLQVQMTLNVTAEAVRF